MNTVHWTALMEFMEAFMEALIKKEKTAIHSRFFALYVKECTFDFKSQCSLNTVQYQSASRSRIGSNQN